MQTTIDADYVAGQRWHNAAQIIQKGEAIHILASHITWMLGDNEFKRPVWRNRKQPPDGKTFDTPTFDQYLLRPPREGLGMPSLLHIHKVCEADAQYGRRAQQMLEKELPNYRELLKQDRLKYEDATRGVEKTGRPEEGTTVVPLSKGGTDRQIAQLKTKHPEIWDRYLAGEFKTVRAAAREAGIVKVKTTLQKLRDLWKKANADEKAEFKKEIE